MALPPEYNKTQKRENTENKRDKLQACLRKESTTEGSLARDFITPAAQAGPQKGGGAEAERSPGQEE